MLLVPGFRDVPSSRVPEMYQLPGFQVPRFQVPELAQFHGSRDVPGSTVQVPRFQVPGIYHGFRFQGCTMGPGSRSFMFPWFQGCTRLPGPGSKVPRFQVPISGGC